MWRLEDKVEGSERFTASGDSDRTKENLIALDGVSGRDEEEEEKGKRALLAMARNEAWSR